MVYHLLSTIKYENEYSKEELNAVYLSRLNGDATIKMDNIPNLMKRGEQSFEKYPAFVVNINAITSLIEQLRRNSERINALASKLPGVANQHYLLQLLTNEIKSTNDIEGVHTTLEEIGTTVDGVLRGIDANMKRSSTVKTYMNIIDETIGRIETLDDIRALYDDLLTGEIDPEKVPDGERFRNGKFPIRIGNSAVTKLIPASDETTINVQLNNWLKLINRQDFNPVVKGLVAHFLFENVHPFNDGNGRLGRYILGSYLARKLDMYTGISISTAIQQNQNNYYKSFEVAGDERNFAEVTLFVRDMMQILADHQTAIIEELDQRKRKLDKVITNISEFVEAGTIEEQVLFLVAQSDLFVDTLEAGIKDNEIISTLKNEHGRDKIRNAIKQLTDQGLLKVPKPRPTRYVQHQLNAVLLK